MTWPDYRWKQAGLARIIDEGNYSDGSTALEIKNFTMDERGVLDNEFRVTPLIGSGWTVGTHPVAFTAGDGCIAMAYLQAWGEVPEILFLCSNGAFRFAPWSRDNAATNGGLEQLYYYDRNITFNDVQPQDKRWFPPQIEVVGNRAYFTFGDGGRAWVWDIDAGRLRPLGFTNRPGRPGSDGPAQGGDGESLYNTNNAGFSNRGRVGTINQTFVDEEGAPVGGVEDGLWRYYCVLEGPDGNYSATSSEGGTVTMRRALGTDDPSTYPYSTPSGKLKRFRVFDIPTGPNPTAARILLRTRNLRNLPPGDDGQPCFLHRIANNVATDYIDDIPDGELGPAWENREVVPTGVFFLKFFNGSMFYMRTQGTPSRIWWSEQTSFNGATPESIMEGHWRDVFPNTGPITGAHSAMLRDDSPTATLLIFKEHAVHYLTGEYPEWSVGTMHNKAGLIGPGLVQSVSDGTVVWYGAGTFWQLTREGHVQDIGEPIRKRLKRVNTVQARLGSSWVDTKSGEVTFVLPMDDATVPNYQFVWDSRVNGFRVREDLRIKAALYIPNVDLTILSGFWDNTTTVWVYGRGYPGNPYSQTRTSVYRSGWLSMLAEKDQPHSTFNARQLVVTLEERGQATSRVDIRTDWNFDANTFSDNVSLTNYSPEIDDLPFYSTDATTVSPAALYDEAVWRTSRAYTVAVSSDSESAEVASVEIVSSERIAIVNIDAYAPKLSGSGGRTPRISEETE